MQVTVLGTGSPLEPWPTTGLLIRAPGADPLLIDTCGGFELWRQLQQAGIAPEEIPQVIATHRHLDHIGGTPVLFMAGHPFDLYALPDTHEAIRAVMAAGFPEWPLNAAVRRLAVTPGEQWPIGGYVVEFFAAQHRVPTVAVRVGRAGHTLAFSADSLPCDALVDCARDADLFLCDALYAERDGADLPARARRLMHPTARQAAQLATAAHARALVLLHLSSRSTRESLRAEAAAAFTGPVAVAEDGATYPV
jgi:ribonuclease BN (tRNA processing enzyme)